MGIQRCELVYDNPAATYYAGQTLSGRLEIQLDSPKKYRGKYLSHKCMIFLHSYVFNYKICVIGV